MTLALCALACLLSALLSLGLGAVGLSPAQLLRVLCGERGTTAANIFLHVRLPRTLACLLAGSALSVSGVVIQQVLANPLAAPNIIGVNAGAGLAVSLCTVLLPTLPAAAPMGAFLGALAAVLLVFTISERCGASRMTLVLAGVAVSAVLNAGTDAVITFFPDSVLSASAFKIGGFASVSMARIRPAGIVIAVGLAILLTLCNELNVLSLGAETAQGLGLPVRKLRLLFLTLAALLAGAAVSFAGLLGFVGLIVPHALRRFTGDECRWLLPACVLGGGAFVTFCDTLSRTLFSPYELPVGILLAFLGGPFFIGLLLRQRGGRVHD